MIHVLTNSCPRSSLYSHFASFQVQDVGAEKDAITSLRAPTHFGRPNWDRVFGSLVEKHPETDVGVVSVLFFSSSFMYFFYGLFGTCVCVLSAFSSHCACFLLLLALALLFCHHPSPLPTLGWWVLGCQPSIWRRARVRFLVRVCVCVCIFFSGFLDRGGSW